MTKIQDIVGAIVGRNIALRRHQLGISEEQFSQCLGVDRDVLTQYESGARRVNAKLLLSIGMILDVAPTYFFARENTDAETPLHKAQRDEFKADRELFLQEGVALNRAFARIGKSKSRQVLIDIALALAEIDRVRA